MNLKVLGSGSSGNCYILENDSEALIIETGISFKEVKKALKFNIRKIVGVIISHSHGDHFKYAHEYEKAGISIFKPYESEMERQVRTYGDFVIKSFQLVHDVPCCGFHIEHPGIGKLVYASDTEYIKYRFKNVNHILVEANYSDEILTDEAINYEHVKRGHMSLETTLDFISTNDNLMLKNIVLMHLSDKNADSAQFLQKTKNTIECSSNVYIAEKGLKVDLKLCPF